MSIKQAQSIVNEVANRLEIALTSYSASDIHWLKDQLEDFLDLEVDPEELSDPDDIQYADFEAAEEDEL